MCVEAIVDNEWCDSTAKLAECLGCEPSDLIEVDWPADVPKTGIKGESCLCPVNMQKTAEKFGYTASYNDSEGCWTLNSPHPEQHR